MKMTNETIKKLTNKEMNDIGCFSIGIVLVRGIAKSRVKGCKTTLKTKDEIHYETESSRFELIKLASDNDFAFRYFNKTLGKYEDFVQPLVAINFVK